LVKGLDKKRESPLHAIAEGGQNHPHHQPLCGVPGCKWISVCGIPQPQPGGLMELRSQGGRKHECWKAMHVSVCTALNRLSIGPCRVIAFHHPKRRTRVSFSELRSTSNGQGDRQNCLGPNSTSAHVPSASIINIQGTLVAYFVTQSSLAIGHSHFTAVNPFPIPDISPSRAQCFMLPVRGTIWDCGLPTSHFLKTCTEIVGFPRESRISKLES